MILTIKVSAHFREVVIADCSDVNPQAAGISQGISVIGHVDGLRFEPKLAIASRGGRVWNLEPSIRRSGRVGRNRPSVGFQLGEKAFAGLGVSEFHDVLRCGSL